MSVYRERPDAVLIAGPTASGKSDFAMRLAEEIDGVVVNADSMQVHAALRVVTARPSVEDEARVPHRLYGTVGLDEPTSTAIYVEKARALLRQLQDENRTPIFVGGTGLYFSALVEGLSFVPPIDPDVRTTVRTLDTPALHGALRDEDPAVAETLRPSDTQRLARALEVIRSTGRSLREWHAEREPGPLANLRLERHLLMPDRAQLHRRIEARAERIVRDPEAVAEVGELVAADPKRRSAVAKAIGVAEIAAMLKGEATRAETEQRLCVATRRYAKRQITWFNNSLRGDWNVKRR